MTTETTEPTNGDEPDGAGATLLGFLIVVVLGSLAYLLLWPDDVEAPRDAGFGDNVFASEPVVFAARLVVLSAALVLAVGSVFVIVSIFKLAANQRWFTRFGPFEASPEAIGDLADEAQFWVTQAEAWSEEATALSQRLEEADSDIQNLLEALDTAHGELDALRGQT